MLSPHDLATLLAVADTGSIRSAALSLGRTQPAVTQAIQRLEEAVGFLLLDRTGYRVRLTERGVTFVQRARATVTQARELQTFAAVLSRGVEPRVRVGVHGAIASRVWLELVRDVAQCFPDTVLEVQHGEGNAPVRRLTEGECELAIVLSFGSSLQTPEIEQRPLGHMEFVNVVQAARLTSSVEADLALLPQILVADFEDRSSPRICPFASSTILMSARPSSSDSALCAASPCSC